MLRWTHARALGPDAGPRRRAVDPLVARVALTADVSRLRGDRGRRRLDRRLGRLARAGVRAGAATARAAHAAARSPGRARDRAGPRPRPADRPTRRGRSLPPVAFRAPARVPRRPPARERGRLPRAAV